MGWGNEHTPITSPLDTIEVEIVMIRRLLERLVIALEEPDPERRKLLSTQLTSARMSLRQSAPQAEGKPRGDQARLV